MANACHKSMKQLLLVLYEIRQRWKTIFLGAFLLSTDYTRDKIRQSLVSNCCKISEDLQLYHTLMFKTIQSITLQCEYIERDIQDKTIQYQNKYLNKYLKIIHIADMPTKMRNNHSNAKNEYIPYIIIMTYLFKQIPSLSFNCSTQMFPKLKILSQVERLVLCTT